VADELLTVANFEFLPQAELACARLKAEGIQAFLIDAETVYMDWFLGNALGYISSRFRAPKPSKPAPCSKVTKPIQITQRQSRLLRSTISRLQTKSMSYWKEDGPRRRLTRTKNLPVQWRPFGR